jgi:thiol-disulfide isomerase/thioredoxin
MNISRFHTFAIQSTSILIVSILALAASSPAQGQTAINEIQWLSNVEEAKAIASRENKLVLLHFGASWCRPCRSLESFVFKSKSVQNAISENVVPVKLDADRALDMVNEYDVQIVPFDIVITPGGRIISERRSPADSDNYAKMIHSTSNASRSLEKEKMGPIAHQRSRIKNRMISGLNADQMRPEAPSVEEFGLSKDGSRLARKQAAFATEGNAQKQTNPWVAKAGPNVDAATESTFDSGVAVADLERSKVLSRQRSWAAPTTATGRAKPQRIVNERYFESIGVTPPDAASTIANRTQSGDQKSTVNPFKLTSATTTVESAPVAEDELLPAEAPQPNVGGDFKLPMDAVAPEEVNTFEAAENAMDLSLDLEISEQEESPSVIEKEAKFGLRGKCPVTLISEGRWEDGNPKYGIVHRDRTYLFSSQEKLEQFRKNPDAFSPVLAGFDPVIYQEEGKLVDGLVENGVFMGKTPNQQVILFKDAATRGKFQLDPKKYLNVVRQATMQTGSESMMR